MLTPGIRTRAFMLARNTLLRTNGDIFEADIAVDNYLKGIGLKPGTGRDYTLLDDVYVIATEAQKELRALDPIVYAQWYRRAMSAPDCGYWQCQPETHSYK